MKKVLVLKSSIMGANSQTNSLIDYYLAERHTKGFNDDVTVLNLNYLNLPVLDGELFNALRGGDSSSEHIRAAVALSDKLITELKASDTVVIGAPMYNLNVPTQLKNWFDLVTRVGKTFRYTDTYPLGLVENINAIVISSRGGSHVGMETDAVTPYLRSVLALIGIHDVKFIYAEGLDIQPHGKAQGVADAHKQIAELLA